MRVRAMILATTILALAGCGGTAGASSSAPSPLGSSHPDMSASSVAVTAPTPVCQDLKPPWVDGAQSVNDGPEPAGRIVFGQVSRSDVYSQVVDPLFAIDPDGSDLVQILELRGGTATHLARWDAARVLDLHERSDMAGRDERHRRERPAHPDVDVRLGVDARLGPGRSWLVYAYSPTPCEIPTCVEDEGFRQTLWRMNADGSDQRLLGDPDAFDSEARLSPDGNEVVFDRWDASKQTNALMIRDLATGIERQVTTTNAGDIEHADWTRDGRSIVYNTNNDSSGTYLELIQTVPANDSAMRANRRCTAMPSTPASSLPTRPMDHRSSSAAMGTFA